MPVHPHETAGSEKAANKPIAAGLVKGVKAKADAPIWPRDIKSGQTYALKLTAAGMKSIALEEEDMVAETNASKSAGTNDNRTSPRLSCLRAKAAGQAATPSEGNRPNEREPCVAKTSLRVPRAGLVRQNRDRFHPASVGATKRNSK
jgi:hypothetical protein